MRFQYIFLLQKNLGIIFLKIYFEDFKVLKIFLAECWFRRERGTFRKIS